MASAIATAAPTGLSPVAPPSIETLQAHSLQLPGEAQLRDVLAELAASTPAAHPAVTSDFRSPGFYFLDTLKQEPPRGVPHTSFDAHPLFDVHAVRRDFPILSERVNGLPLIWFDSAATTQKPLAVIDRLAHFYRHESSNIHRAAHELAARPNVSIWLRRGGDVPTCALAMKSSSRISNTTPILCRGSN